MMVKKIVSGGQSGTGRAALDVAMELRIHHGGWIPRGRKTDTGPLPTRYKLKEILAGGYFKSVELNVIDSDGTLVISRGELTGESGLAKKLSKKHRRPCLHIDLDDISDFKAVEIISSWINVRGIKILNITGPRVSDDPRIYDATKRILQYVFYPPPDHVVPRRPKTVDDVVKGLITELPLKDKTTIANMTEQELAFLDRTLGNDIRNRFGLGSGNNELLRSCRFVSGMKELSVNDASAIIISRLWKKLQETHALRVVK